MKSLIISASDIMGGAAKAAYRLHRGLDQLGVESHMLVQEKLSGDSQVHAPISRLQQSIAHTRVAIDALPLKRYPQKSGTFSLQWLPDTVVRKIQQTDPDVINLHWIEKGFVRIESIPQFRKPVVWTLHDMWAFTGGCHYSYDCDRYLQSCGACPQLGSFKTRDLSRWVWQRKAQSWHKIRPTIVTPSIWLKQCAQSSHLFKDLRIEAIPNGVNTQVFRPINKQLARELLGLPKDKKIALFGAVKATSDRRKGFHLLQSTLLELQQLGWAECLELAIFGATCPEHPPDFGLKTYYLGRFSDDLSIALIYASADVFVLPSIQDNLPNTVMEAISCGTPCVAFKVGGTPDMIEHQENGYLAHPYDTSDLAKGIAWILEHPERHQKLSRCAREKAETEFTQEIQARRYRALFNEICE